MINVDRNHTVLKKIDKKEDNYMNASLTQRVSFIGELTQEKYKRSAQRKLQRHLTKLIRKK